jgi:hypothetical protein
MHLHFMAKHPGANSPCSQRTHHDGVERGELGGASGGIYSSGPMAAVDFLVPYLKHTLGCMGLTDVETIRIEAQSFGPEAADTSVVEAMGQVEMLAAGARVAHAASGQNQQTLG